MNNGSRINIAVAGAGEASGNIASTAYEVGRLVAMQKWVLICGGLGGVMLEASKGAVENNGTTIGFLPGYDKTTANDYIKIAIPTGMGHARNALLASAADALVTVGGGHGTLSEIALGLKMGKPVITLFCNYDVKGAVPAKNAEDAVKQIKELLGWTHC